MKLSLTPTKWRAARLFVLLAAVTASALAAAGCGSSVDKTLVNRAGVHGNALEAVYVTYNRDVLKSASTRDLKDINAALKASDLKKATPGAVRRAQAEIHSRINQVSAYGAQLAKQNRTLKNTPLPDFAAGLDSNFANKEFNKDYKATAKYVQSYTTAALVAVKYATSSLDKYLSFLEQWEVYLGNNSTAGLVSSGKASDVALARFNKQVKIVDRKGTLPSKIRPLVASMASASSDSKQLASLIGELKKQYPKSFLAVHIVEKK